MVVLTVTVGFFVLRLVAAKLVFAHQVTLYEQVERIINCCPADAVIFVFHTDVERFYIKMTAAGINLLEDSKAFGSFTQVFVFQICSKDFFTSSYLSCGACMIFLIRTMPYFVSTNVIKIICSRINQKDKKKSG